MILLLNNIFPILYNNKYVFSIYQSYIVSFFYIILYLLKNIKADQFFCGVINGKVSSNSGQNRFIIFLSTRA